MTRRKRARRANGEGDVWERPDTGRIQASVVVGWTPKGNARRISKSFDTKEQLRAGAKTSSGQRVIPIDAFTESQLRRQREYVDELQRARLALNEKRAAKRLEPLPWTGLNLVFCTSVGTILDRGTLRRHVNEIQTAAGVTLIKLYATRSTHGSLLADAGVNLHALAERLGHSVPRFTAKVYLRGNSTAHRAVADQVGAILEAGARCSVVAVGTENPVTEAPEASTASLGASAGTSLETQERPN